ncbi:MAG: DUF4350 domain-containing protein [Gemmatimonadetes bacterium]|nr:DUF4350 domain-containing protein [Gemmatimonadota bacterium]
MTNERGVWLTTCAVIVVVVAGLWILSPAGQPTRFERGRSSLNVRPPGTAAIARATERFGVPVARRRTPLVDADPLGGVIVLIQPAVPLSPRELDAVLGWTEAGGRLVYVPHFAGNTDREDAEHEPRGTLLARLGLVLAGDVGEETGGPLAAVARQKLGQPPNTETVRDTAVWREHPLTAGLSEWTPRRFFAPRRGQRPSDSVSMDTLAVLSGGPYAGAPAAGIVQTGDGRILVIADAADLANQAAATSPLPTLFIRAAREWTAAGDTLFFAEFHQGLTEVSASDVLFSFLRDTGPGRALFQVGLVALLAVAVGGLRFGVPADPPAPERRSPLEHVTALANLYSRAGARETAATLLVTPLAKVARRPAPRTGAEALELVSLLARRKRGRADRERAPLRDLRAAMQSDPPDLAGIAKHTDRLVHLARHGVG